MARSPAALRQVAAVGVGQTGFTRQSGRTTLAMAAEACRAALADAGLEPADVDGMVTYMAYDSNWPLDVSWAIGLDELAFSVACYGGGSSVTAAITVAADAIQTGQCDVVVVYRSVNARSGIRLGSGEMAASVGRSQSFNSGQGYLFAPQFAAMWARRHQAVYGSTSEDLGQIAVTQRNHALDNPLAIARTPLTMEQYLEARIIDEPFRLYDCTYEIDGAVAVVLVAADRAADTRTKPVWYLTSAESQSGLGWEQWDDYTTMYSRYVAPRLWGKSGLGPADIDVACMYDCFTYTVMATMEDYGFCEKGGVGEFFAKGRATYGGDVVVNPHGGLLSEGYLQGLNHHREAIVQLRDGAGSRQVAGADLALVTGGAGPYGGAVLYSATQS